MNPLKSSVQKYESIPDTKQEGLRDKKTPRTCMMVVAAVLILTVICAVVVALVANGSKSWKGDRLDRLGGATVPVKGQFYLVSDKYQQHILCMDGGNKNLYTCTNSAINTNALWYLRESGNNPGYYNIMNVGQPDYRINRWGTAMGTYGGSYYGPSQLWRFVKSGSAKGLYLIANKINSGCLLAKYNSDPADIECWRSSQSGRGEVWHVVPRFQVAVTPRIIWSFDNRQGSQDFSQTLKVERGVTKSREESVTVTKSLKSTMELSVAYGAVSASASLEISQTVERTVTVGTEITTTSTVETTFTAPAGKNYRVWQYVITFSGRFGVSDRFQVIGPYRIEESSNAFTNRR